MEFTANIEQDANGLFIGKLVEYPEVMSQGKSEFELKERLVLAFSLFIAESIKFKPTDIPKKIKSINSKGIIKRGIFIRFLNINNCFLVKDGHGHTVYKNQENGRTITLPNDQELSDLLSRNISDFLKIPYLK
jgi:predicted RNase H-like HicB family nuclease